MIHKNLSKLLFTAVFSCCLISSLSAMRHERPTGPQGYTSFKECAKDWGWTLFPVAGLMIYTLRYDQKFLSKIVHAAKQTLLPVATPKNMLVMYPSLVAASHVAYSYYQPRIQDTYGYLKAKLNGLIK